MSTTLLALLLGLGQGLLHGLGPDHCAAIATLGAATGPDGRRRSALSLAVRFAVGHALALGLLAGACLLLGMTLSESFERYAEFLGGLVLLGVALAALFFPGALRHGHPHPPGHGDDHHHHAPALPLASAAGALMAISGVRSLLLALPPLMVGGRFASAAWAYLPGFALGVLVSMGAVGLAFSAGLARTPARAVRWLEKGVAVSSGALGVYWMAARLF